MYAPPGKLGLLFREKDGSHRVAGVQPGSPLGGRVTKGDRIMAVDGVDTSGATHDVVVKLLASKADQKERVLLIEAGEWRLRDVHVPAGSLGLSFVAGGSLSGSSARVGEVRDETRRRQRDDASARRQRDARALSLSRISR